VDAFPDESAPAYLLRDRDQVYGQQFRHRITALGVEEILTTSHSPWQNPFAERFIGSIRRECLNHVLVLGERHLPCLLPSGAHPPRARQGRTRLPVYRASGDGEDRAASRSRRPAPPLPPPGRVIQHRQECCPTRNARHRSSWCVLCRTDSPAGASGRQPPAVDSLITALHAGSVGSRTSRKGSPSAWDGVLAKDRPRLGRVWPGDVSLRGLEAGRRDPGPGQGPPPPSHLSSGAGPAASLRLDALPPESAGELLTALLGDDSGQEPHRQPLVRRGKGSVAAYAPSS
jgi:hypothetical protein